MIVLSTKEEPKTKAEAFSVGANDYLVKLPDALELIARIRYHSQGYINLLQRNEAFSRLQSSLKDVEKRNRFIKDVFGRYLSDEIVNQLVETPEGLQLGGEKRRVTIMMTDLRGFTSMAERLAPEQVVSVINNFLGLMTEVIVKHQGTIDEFIGDAILVIFGAPIQRPDDALRAVACAVEMQLTMEEVNRRNREAGMPEVEMGIGLNTGEVVVGNIGSAKRAKYGVVGSNVNLTSRIESYTTGGQILVSEATKAEAGEGVEIGEAMEVMPKGVKKPITIYSVTGVAGRYGMRLKAARAEIVPLTTELAIRFVVAEGKDTSGTIFDGRIVGLSHKDADVRADEVPATLSNLKVQLFAADGTLVTDDIYAKVSAHSGPGGFVMRFTSVPKEAEGFLEASRRSA
jgi:adenylate cyclase